MRNSIARIASLTAAAALGAAALIAAPAAQAADGETSLASVLGVGKAKFDGNHKDYDIVTKAAEAVLQAKPDSAVKVLADGSVALTAFIPNDQAFMNLASALKGHKVKTEAAAFKTVAGLGVDTVEQVLLYHVVPGSTIMSADALKANGAKLKTAEGKTISVRVTKAPAIILGDKARKIANPRVILNQVDINDGNKQIAHGIDGVLLPFAP
ncbi:MAG: fasciclin domain-containing protein [Actinomycetales bacterium]|nr:fasciclin domain-containing protein [Actinomycetales bacterium]